MWPFRRRRDEPEPTDAPSASPATGEADVARPERVPTGDWMTVPPVRTSIAPMPTTFRVQTLPDILTSHHDTRLSGSLGHAVSADGPSGTVAGLATTSGSVSAAPTGGPAALPLREPAHHHEPEAPAPLVARRLATADSTPLPASGAATAAAALPEPSVSRVLANPAPLPSPASLGGNPLPVARVVDAPAASSAAADAPTFAPEPGGAPSTAPDADGGGLVGDDRIGGFEVPLETLTGGDDALPVSRMAAPPDLAPPIQPRRVQRRADGTPAAPPAPRITMPPTPLGSSPSAETAGSTAPLVAPPTTAATATPAASPADRPLREPARPAGAPADAAVGPTTSEPDLPLARLADSSPSADAPVAAAASPSADTDEGPVAAGAEVAPLPGGLDVRAADPISPSSPDLGATGTEAPRPDLPLHAPTATTGAAPAPAAPAVQRAAETSAPAPPSPSTAADAPDRPLAATPAATAATAAPTPSATAADAGDDRHEEGPADDAPTPPSTAPTLGADSPLLRVQSLADSGLGQASESTGGGTAALPLVAAEPAGTLVPPAGAASWPAPGAPAEVVDRSGETTTGTLGTIGATSLGGASSASGGGTGSSAGPAPLVSRSLSAPSSGASAPAGTAPLGLQRSPATLPLAGSSPLVQRLATGSGAGTTTGLASSSPSPSMAGGVASLVRPPAAPSGHGSSDAGSSDEPVALRRLPVDVPDLATAALVAPVQRAAAIATSTATTPATGSASSTSGGATTGSSLPLHTAAASIPTAADVAVKAGLAERAPDGSLLYTSPPAATFDVQRSPDGSAPAPAAPPPGATGTPTSFVVQRAVQVDEVSTDVSTGTGSATTNAKDLAEEARKLYPYLRSRLEADLRRQLDGKSRSGRPRP